MQISFIAENHLNTDRVIFRIVSFLVKNKVLTKQKAWCIVCLAGDNLFAKHELYATKGAKMLINRGITTKSNPILYFNFTFKRFDINKILCRIYHKIAFAKRVL